jgi:hypothetical protein
MMDLALIAKEKIAEIPTLLVGDADYEAPRRELQRQAQQILRLHWDQGLTKRFYFISCRSLRLFPDCRQFGSWWR